jgi:hypothetical protein
VRGHFIASELKKPRSDFFNSINVKATFEGAREDSVQWVWMAELDDREQNASRKRSSQQLVRLNGTKRPVGGVGRLARVYTSIDVHDARYSTVAIQ